jgi:hypothetical protein
LPTPNSDIVSKRSCTPPCSARIDALLAAAKARGDSVLLDAPLLLETGLDARCDVLVFVAASADVRAARAATRGWPAHELERREAAQTPLATKQARADYTVHNDGSLAATEQQVASLLDTLAAPPLRCDAVPSAPSATTAQGTLPPSARNGMVKSPSPRASVARLRIPSSRTRRNNPRVTHR